MDSRGSAAGPDRELDPANPQASSSRRGAPTPDPDPHHPDVAAMLTRWRRQPNAGSDGDGDDDDDPESPPAWIPRIATTSSTAVPATPSIRSAPHARPLPPYTSAYSPMNISPPIAVNTSAADDNSDADAASTLGALMGWSTQSSSIAAPAAAAARPPPQQPPPPPTHASQQPSAAMQPPSLPPFVSSGLPPLPAMTAYEQSMRDRRAAELLHNVPETLSPSTIRKAWDPSRSPPLLPDSRSNAVERRDGPVAAAAGGGLDVHRPGPSDALSHFHSSCGGGADFGPPIEADTDASIDGGGAPPLIAASTDAAAAPTTDRDVVEDVALRIRQMRRAHRYGFVKCPEIAQKLMHLPSNRPSPDGGITVNRPIRMRRRDDKVSTRVQKPRAAAGPPHASSSSSLSVGGKLLVEGLAASVDLVAAKDVLAAAGATVVERAGPAAEP
jgi:hypothetical protein